MKIKLPIRVWILIIVLILSMLAINPSPGVQGVQIRTVEAGSIAADAGLASGQIVKTVNGVAIETVADFKREFEKLDVLSEREIVIRTNDGNRHYYNITDTIGFDVDENLTIISTDYSVPLKLGVKVKQIGETWVSDISEFNAAKEKIIPKSVVKIGTSDGEIAFLTSGQPKVTVGKAEKSNLKQGQDLAGGTRVLLKPIPKEGQTVTESGISDLIKIISNRLNVYGLSDLRIRSAKDREGQKFVLIEIAGATRDEVKTLIAQQGVFEAKIGNETVFEGGKRDVPFVCRDDGSCSGIRSCVQVDANQWNCKFEFVIHLSPEAAKRHANVTGALDIVPSESSGRDILSQNIDFYLDSKMVDSLQISSDLKGSETTSIAISGPGVGPTRQAAAEAALANMDKLQTILITGSLPFDIEIAKLDSISPVLGQSFLKNAIIVGIAALLSVAVVIFIRYRNFKILLPMMFTSISEVLIILGFAALIQWNLDIAAIAGILAAIGTGVDHQIVIIDEVSGGQVVSNWKEKIKRAFFIIMVAYATTVAAMIPLWNAGAGLVRGFALTTIAGVTIGVFITRPAFAAIAEKLFK